MSPNIWVFATIGLIVLILVLVFLYFCKSSIFSKAISTILATLAVVAGSRAAPNYKATFSFHNDWVSFNGDIAAGEAGSNTTLLIVVLGVTLITLIVAAAFLKPNLKSLD
jgi:hypothetical protein